MLHLSKKSGFGKNAGLLCAFLLLMALPVSAADFTCKGERIEKGNSTWGAAVKSGSDYRIEKGSSTIAFVKPRNGKWVIESGSSTLGWLNGSRIENASGNSWDSLSNAKSFCSGPDPVAAAMWILNKLGKL